MLSENNAAPDGESRADAKLTYKTDGRNSAGQNLSKESITRKCRAPRWRSAVSRTVPLSGTFAAHDERNDVHQYDFSSVGQSSPVVVEYTLSSPPAWCAAMRRYLGGDASAWATAGKLFFEQRGREGAL